jgi:penicillin-binding protein 1A
LRPTDHFNDGPIKIGDWRPHNYENEYRGDVTVADAVAYSINTVAAQVIDRTGVDNVIAAARRLGITADLGRDDSLALGTSEVTLLEMTAAYAAFASDGYAAWPHGIIEIRDAHGGVLYRRSGSGAPRVIDPNIAAEMNELLMGVIERGTGRAAQLPGRPVAGKTGTTQDSRDALFFGYTADLVAGVWLGNDDNSPMRKVTGGTLPARAWKAFMAPAVAGDPVRDLALPGSIMASSSNYAPGGFPPPPDAPPPPSGGGGILQNMINSIFGGPR